MIAQGAEARLTVNQGAGTGWQPIGVFTFDAGGSQQIAVYDNATGSFASGQHVTADAVRLTRLDPWCGDGVCDAGETCIDCAGDCGDCPSCGDGECNGAETCDACPGDYGGCAPVCGDGACNGAETCADCPTDCGGCASVCGDGACSGAGSCETCPTDCV